MMADRIKIAIGMGTYQRPKMLSQALESLKGLELSDGLKIILILCDNDPERSGQLVFQKLSSALLFESKYCHEEARGIVPVRNRILEVAIEHECDWLAFIDDDEKVDSEWLSKLIETAHAYEADAVEGLVKYELPEKCEEWIAEMDFYGKKPRKTGDKLFSASTNNVLVSLRFVGENNLRFNSRLNQSGSSDTHFFSELRRKGGKLVWCNEAITYETVPLSKTSKNWIMERAFKTGYTTHIRNTIRFGSVGAMFISLFIHIPFYFVKWILLSFKNGIFKKSSRVMNNRQLQMAKGSLSATFGKTFIAYQEIHGN